MEFLAHFKIDGKHFAIVENDEKLFKVDTRWNMERICLSQACDPVEEMIFIIADAEEIYSVKEEVKKRIFFYLVEDGLSDIYENGTAIYEDAIIDRIGEDGLSVLRRCNLIENCGVINGRRLYVA